MRSEQLVAVVGGRGGGGAAREPRGRRSAFGSRYQATAADDLEVFMCAIVTVAL